MPRIDPRLYQITALTLLLAWGVFALDLQGALSRAAVVMAAAIAAQAVCSRLAGIRFDPRSAAISGLSLTLLLRAGSIIPLLAAAALAVGGKFAIRWRGKHLFNPTNFAIVVLLMTGAPVWVSPGQWGSVAFFGFLVVCLGGLVVNRAARSDVPLAFIAAWAAIVIGRSLWLGEPMTIPLHRLQNGALLIFTFFMISDPKTTPDSRAGRILFAAIVALGAGFVQFHLFGTNGVLWSLFAAAPLVPLLDAVFPDTRYEWPRPIPHAEARKTVAEGGAPWPAVS
ncbi:MAG TPA: RnfABCDGE type electron transport complex subunit D [Thermoanaerobaculia bacterium]|nr:RnfABCDGE type electron transport complex subunit D [Thermoanaerobaculia bacterium]